MAEAARCEHDGIRWFPRVTVEKYSPDQTEYAERKLREELSWGRRLLVSRFNLRTPRLHGDLLREMFREPEDGYARSEGNNLVNTGLVNLVNLLLGNSGTAINPLRLGTATGPTVVGVGTNGGVSTGGSATMTDTTLTGDTGTGSTTSYFQAMDATYPNVSTGTGLISGQSTFATGNANFAWNEWCWATGGGVLTPGVHLASVYATAASFAMLNKKYPTGGLGTKAAGASWVFSQTVQFS